MANGFSVGVFFFGEATFFHRFMHQGMKAIKE